MNCRHLVIFLMLCLLPTPALAQKLSAAAIISKVQAAQADLKDLRLQLKGDLRQAGKALAGELELQAIPSLKLRRITFASPASLAGNVIVIDQDQVYRYLALTNQVFVSDTAAAAKHAAFDVSKLAVLAHGAMTDQAVKLVGSELTPAGKAYVLEASLEQQRCKLWILSDAWRIYRISTYDPKGELQADWTVTDFRANTGLQPAALRMLPKDAEVIRR